jgi:hypothetical protein
LSLLGPNIPLNTLFSNTLSLHSSLNTSNQVSHPYKTKCKIIVLYIFIFTFLDSKNDLSNADVMQSQVGWENVNDVLKGAYSGPFIWKDEGYCDEFVR